LCCYCCYTAALAVIDEQKMPARSQTGLDPGQGNQNQRIVEGAHQYVRVVSKWLKTPKKSRLSSV
jgi:hypothetical protein